MPKRKTEFLVADLRRVGPNPPRTLPEALRIAQRQAKNLLLITKTYQPPVDPEILTADPKIELRYTGSLTKVAGFCRWVGWRYVIAINKREPVARQRFTAFHEFKHALDGARTTAAIDRFTREGNRSASEYVADYFASCVLMPEPWIAQELKRTNDLNELVRVFSVSKQAMRVRLEALDLDQLVAGARVA